MDSLQAQTPHAQVSALSKAISIWRSGRAIPLDIFAELREQGYDVPRLEAFYRK